MFAADRSYSYIYLCVFVVGSLSFNIIISPFCTQISFWYYNSNLLMVEIVLSLCSKVSNWTHRAAKFGSFFCPYFWCNFPYLRSHKVSLCSWAFWRWENLASWHCFRRTANHIDNRWSHRSRSGFDHCSQWLFLWVFFSLINYMHLVDFELTTFSKVVSYEGRTCHLSGIVYLSLKYQFVWFPFLLIYFKSS